LLHFYAFSNFQSFLDRTEVSLRLTEKSAVRGWDTEAPSGQRLTTALAAIGPNAAGKTTLLKPLAFIAWFVNDSFALKPTERLAISPHFGAADQPSEFELEADDEDGVVWRYLLRATPERVEYEALFRKRDRFNYVFVREWDEQAQGYSIKQKDFGMASGEAQKVRQNASLISTAVQYGVELASRVSGFLLSTNITPAGREHYSTTVLARAAEFFANDGSKLQPLMKRLLRSWDMGLEDISVKEFQVQTPTGGEPRKVWLPVGLHASRDGRKHELAFMQESRGTQSAFVLLSILLPALASGGVALIDEFENDLHPHMLKPILDLFANKRTNPRQAQLIFTCHAGEVLNFLHKSQVVLVEKTDCESQAWRLDTMQGVRSDDNLYAKYMSGSFGAVPQV